MICFACVRVAVVVVILLHVAKQINIAGSVAAVGHWEWSYASASNDELHSMAITAKMELQKAETELQNRDVG